MGRSTAIDHTEALWVLDLSVIMRNNYSCTKGIMGTSLVRVTFWDYGYTWPRGALVLTPFYTSSAPCGMRMCLLLVSTIDKTYDLASFKLHSLKDKGKEVASCLNCSESSDSSTLLLLLFAKFGPQMPRAETK